MRKMAFLLLGLLLLTGFLGANGSAQPRTIHEAFMLIEDCLGDFGGFYFDERGNINVYLLKPAPARVREVEACLIRVLGQGVLTEFFSGRVDGRRSAIILHQGQFVMSDLIKYFGELADPVLDLEGAHFVDLDERRNGLEVGVSDRALFDKVREVVGGLGIPQEAVHIKLTDPISVDVLDLGDRVRPAVGGIRITSAAGGCTLGFSARLDGMWGFVTNSHCTAVPGSVTGTVFSNSGARLGAEVRDPTYSRCGFLWRRACRDSDSAFVRYDSGVDFRLGEIARTTFWRGPCAGSGSTTVHATYSTMKIVRDRLFPFSGWMVDKMGATTGWTYGFVDRTCATVNVADATVDGRPVRLICQDRADYTGASGDSGSPVFVWNSDYSVELLGVHWGGADTGCSRRSWFSNLGNIIDELGRLTTH